MHPAPTLRCQTVSPREYVLFLHATLQTIAVPVRSNTMTAMDECVHTTRFRV